MHVCECVCACMHAHKELMHVHMYMGVCKHTVNTDGVGTELREVCEGPVMNRWGVTERQTDRERERGGDRDKRGEVTKWQKPNSDYNTPYQLSQTSQHSTTYQGPSTAQPANHPQRDPSPQPDRPDQTRQADRGRGAILLNVHLCTSQIACSLVGGRPSAAAGEVSMGLRM